MPDRAQQTHRARTLRSNVTTAECRLWQVLSQHRPRFTRQLPVGPYIADLACRSARLIVEIDGSQHAESANDARRTVLLEHEGWKVIRFWNNDVLNNVEGVVETIAHEVNARLPDGATFQPVASRSGRQRNPRTRG